MFKPDMFVNLRFLLQVPYSVLDRPTSQRVWPVFRNLYEHTSDFQLTSAYGLFRRMTGVGGRPEVILEGANSLEGSWVEYEFPYKPGSLDRMPGFVSKCFSAEILFKSLCKLGIE